MNPSYNKDIIIKIIPNFEKGASSDLKYFNNGMDIETLSLKTLFGDYQIDKAVLRMNYNRYEYNLFREDNDTLTEYKRIKTDYYHNY